LLCLSQKAVFVGGDFLEDDLRLKETNGVENVQLTVFLVLGDVLKMGRIIGRSPVLILGIRRILIELLLLFKGNKPR
jgi:hypothetical protein